MDFLHAAAVYCFAMGAPASAAGNRMNVAPLPWRICGFLGGLFLYQIQVTVLAHLKPCLVNTVFCMILLTNRLKFG
jgi:hypothetical protein